MGYKTVNDIRASWGKDWANASDESVIQAYSRSVGANPVEVANALGYDPGSGSMWKERASSSVDNYQSGMYGLGEALSPKGSAVEKWMRSGRQDNEFQSEVASARAKSLGAIDSYKDVHGVGDALNYVGGVGVTSLPYLAEAAVGGMAVRGLSGGLRTAANAGRAVDASEDVINAGRLAEKALGRRQAAGLFASSYPSSVADILGNQREQLREQGLDDTKTDLLAAGLGGVAYAGLNVVDPMNRLAATGRIGRGVTALDGLQGARGVAARTGVNAATTGLLEGANELGQEMINQYAGRMAVDPNETFFNDKSSDRFAQSFVGGAALGGLAGGAAGGWRRSNQYADKQLEAARAARIESGATTDLTTSQGFDPAPQRQAPTPPLADVTDLWTTSLGAADQVRYGGGVDPVGLHVPLGDPGPTTGTNPLGNQLQMPVVPGRPGMADTMVAGLPGEIAGTDAQVAAMSDPGTLAAIKQHAQMLQQQDERNQAAAQAQAERTALHQRVQAAGLDPKKGVHIQIFSDLEDAQKDGLLSNADVGAHIGRILAGASPAEARKDIKLKEKQRQTLIQARALEQQGKLPQGATQVVQNAVAEGGDGTAQLKAELKNQEQINKEPANGAQSVSGTQPVASGAAGGANAQGSVAVAGRNTAAGAGGATPAGAGAVVSQVATKPADGAKPAGPSAVKAPRRVPAGTFTKAVPNVPQAAETKQAEPKQAPAKKGLLTAEIQQRLAEVPVVLPGNYLDLGRLSNLLEHRNNGLYNAILAYVGVDEDGHRTDTVSQEKAALANGIKQYELSEALKGLGITRAVVNRFGVNSNVADDERKADKAAAEAKATGEYLTKATDSEGNVRTSDDLGRVDSTAGEEDPAALGLRVVDSAAASHWNVAASARGNMLTKPWMGVLMKHVTAVLVSEHGQDAAMPGDVKGFSELVGKAVKRLANKELGFVTEHAWAHFDTASEMEQAVQAAVLQEVEHRLRDNTGARAAIISDIEAGRKLALKKKEESNEAADATATERNDRGSSGEKGKEPSTGRQGVERSDAGKNAATGERQAAKPSGSPISRAIEAIDDDAKYVLEQHYGKKAGTAAFEAKVKEDLKAINEDQDAFYAENDEAVLDALLTVQDELMAGSAPAFSKGTADGATHTVDSLRKSLEDFMGVDSLGRNVQIVGSAEDLSDVRDLVAFNTANAMAWTRGGKAYIIADRVPKGQERAVFMHEVGGHLGLDRLLTAGMHKRLAEKVREWAAKDDGSVESKIAKKAVARAEAAGTAAEDLNAEHIGYFIEEAMKAGVDPSALRPEVRNWFRTLWAAFKSAIRKLGFNRALTAQDVLDMAYGAARLEVNGRWHGAAAIFRKFDHAFMGTGEGAQAYGWGTYTAERMGVGTDYWRRDVRRKSTGDLFTMNNGAPVTDRKLHDTLLDMRRNDALDGVGDLERLKSAWESSIAKYGDHPQLQRDKRQLEYALTELQDAIDAGGVAYSRANKPDGALMRNDINVRDRELLHWDKPFDAQSEHVKNVLSNLTYGREDAFLHYPTIGDWYRALESHLESADDEWDINQFRGILDHWEANRDEGSFAKAVSEWLNAAGIKGIMHTDAPSRDNPAVIKYDGKTYTADELKAERKKHSDTDVMEAAKFAVLRDVLRSGLDATIRHYETKVNNLTHMFAQNREDAYKRYSKEPYTEDMARKDYEKARQEAEELYEGQILKFLRENKISVEKQDATHNRIIFDEKNIQRVASLVAADKERTFFSKAADATADYEDRAAHVRSMMSAKTRSLWDSTKDFISKTAPALLSNGQIVEQYGHRFKKSGALANYVGQQQSMAKMRNDSAMKFHNIASVWAGLKNKDALNALMLQATLKQIHPDEAFTPGQKDTPNGHLTANDQAAYDALKKKYDALGIDAQKVYKDAKDQLRAQWDERRKAYKSLVDYTYSGRIADAMGRNDTAAHEALKAEGEKLIKEYDDQLNEIKGPYFPLMRFGTYLAIGESKELLALKESMENLTGAARREAEAKLEAMKKDEAHYVVSAHETKGKQNEAVRKYEAAGMVPRRDLTDQNLDRLSSSAFSAISNIGHMVDAVFDKDVASQINDGLANIMLRSLPEVHALRREAHRKGIAGAEADMLRAFASAGQTGSFYNSRLSHAAAMSDAMWSMKQEAKGDIDLQHIHREMEKRMSLDMKHNDTPVQDFAASLSWMYHLGMSPSNWALNSLQPWLVGAPLIAGRYGMTAALREMGKATKDATAILKTARFKPDGKIDWWSGINENSVPGTNDGHVERKALRELMNRGIVDEGMVHDLQSMAAGGMDWLSKVNRVVGWTNQQVELVNRTATALAAFRLEYAKKGDYDAALKYAYDMTLNSQFDYSAEGSARIMREGGGVPMARLVFQFRKFQQGMLYTLFTNMRKAFKGDKEARAALGYLSLASGMAAGTLGLPFMNAALWAIDKFGDPDDPEGDARTKLRNYLYTMSGDKKLADVLAKGIPAAWGWDVSSRIGLGDIASPFPVARFDGKNGKDLGGQLALAVAGPAASTMANFYDSYVAFGEGDWERGVEKMSPKMVADMFKAGRYATAGMTDSMGNRTGTKLDTGDIASRAFGFTPNRESDYYEGTSALKNVESAIKSREAKIHKKFVEALSGNGSMASVRELIDEFNADHPEARINGKKELDWRKAARSSGQNRTESGVKLGDKQPSKYSQVASFAG